MTETSSDKFNNKYLSMKAVSVDTGEKMENLEKHCSTSLTKEEIEQNELEYQKLALRYLESKPFPDKLQKIPITSLYFNN